MCTRFKTSKKMTIVLLIALLILLQGATGSSALAASQPATDKPISGKTSTTVPAGKVIPGQTTTTAPLPSTAPAREYQQVDKPPAKKLDIPEYDLAGKLSEVRFEKPQNFSYKENKIIFKVSLKNHGTRRIPAGTKILTRTRLINITTNTIIFDKTTLISNDDFDLKSGYWVEMLPQTTVEFELGASPAPETINELKLVVDVDPRNQFPEAQRHRGNNRCVATW